MTVPDEIHFKVKKKVWTYFLHEKRWQLFKMAEATVQQARIHVSKWRQQQASLDVTAALWAQLFAPVLSLRLFSLPSLVTCLRFCGVGFLAGLGAWEPVLSASLCRWKPLRRLGYKMASAHKMDPNHKSFPVIATEEILHYFNVCRGKFSTV